MALVTLIFILYACSRACEAAEAQVDSRASFFSDAVSLVLKGAPDKGIQSADPLYINYFEGTFGTLQYKNYNNTVTGLKNCTTSNFVVSKDGSVVNFVMECPRHVLYSSNEVRGYLLYKNIEGRGTLEIDYRNYTVRVYAPLSYVTDGYYNQYYRVGQFSLDIDIGGPVYYNFMHLYNNNKVKNDEINKFANENWKVCAFFSKNTVWYPIMTKVVANLNKYLLTAAISFDEATYK